MKYQVMRAVKPMVIDGNWNKSAWANIRPLDVKHFMGEKPEHQPKTQAKLLYDDKSMYVFFRVEDRYVRAVNKNCPEVVCEDSCVEFFFTPGADVDIGYFNIEINCGGTLLFNHQSAPGRNEKTLEKSDCEQVEIFHSLPTTVEPEITEPTIWTLEYRFPFEPLKKYSPITKPQPGTIWRANFYKCADKTSHPHWLTWSVVDGKLPNFHLPQFFGVLEFK